MKTIKVNYNDVDWNWDDDYMLGNFTVKCICGKILTSKCFHIADDELICPKCDYTYYVERGTFVYGFKRGGKDVEKDEVLKKVC
jgi:hypothetical protein